MLSLLVAQAFAAPPALAIVPFGVGVYAHGKPARGVVYTVTQAAGIGLLTWGTVNGYEAAYEEDDAAFARWQAVTVAGASTAVLSYLVSALDASRLHEIEMGDEEKQRVMRWDEARFAAEHAAALRDASAAP